jgi:hypothetical protein
MVDVVTKKEINIICYLRMQTNISTHKGGRKMARKGIITLLVICCAALFTGCVAARHAGEARSHCLANTVLDIANNFGEENIKKMVLLEDGTSDVPGFENLGEDFVKEMKGRGMRISTTVDYLK